MKKILLIFLFIPLYISAQYTEVVDSAAKVKVNRNELPPLTSYKNTIRWNLTPFVVLGHRNINLGYERVLNEKSSVSINAGYLEIPILLTTSDKIEYVEGDKDRGGFSLFVDYKRYIANRNKRKAPEGLYWGAYTGIYNQKFSTVYKLIDDKSILASADLGLTVNDYNLGLQLGYQFVFRDRFTLDLILVGPSVSIYTGRLRGEIEVYDENMEDSDVYKEFIDMITEKAPWLLDAVDEDQIYAQGTNTNFSIFSGSFRYVVQIGYRF
jgi:hypothetical protein